MKPCERPIDTMRAYLADPETSSSSKVYNAILLAVELIEARDRVTGLMEELT